MTAMRKAREIGERRRERRAEKHNATQAALELAEEAGLDVDEVDGSGAAGRVTVRDVRQAVA
jgi:pyruvate/2-oxoglutarate dehydrogenase complex dihydrolipoamide acyltransferase (E2) component